MAIITDFNLITAYGVGIDCLWKGINSNISAIDKNLNRALISGLKRDLNHSMIFQLLDQIISPNIDLFKNYPVFFASTKGEIDVFELQVENKFNKFITFPETLEKLKTKYLLNETPILVSAACASSTIAIANATSMIQNELIPGAVIIGVDVITDFIYSGFSSLLALDQKPASPFDKERKGLSLGNAACFIVLRSEKEAIKNKKKFLGKILGSGITNDANHPTGPSRTGNGLAKAINLSFKTSNTKATDIGVICAHATGTVYNDLMEINAFKSIFTNPVPTFGIKGATGHTLGACGMIEVLVTLKALHNKHTPINVNLNIIDENMKNWVFKEQQKIDSNIAITTNSGFGGINASLVLGL